MRWRGVPLVLGLVLVAIVAIILVSVLGSGSAKHPRLAARPAPSSTPTAPAPAPTTPAPPSPVRSPSPTAPPPPSHSLGALPGGLGHATGTVLLLGPRRHLRLRLTVRHLPAVHGGHYEVWLYNSILDSDPLARLGSGVTKVTLRLPSNAPRFRWIDVSFQPTGLVNHSGESVLRAANPATARKLPKKRSARRRRLRRTTARFGHTKRSR